MPSPQVQQWLDDGSRLREDLLADMEKLESQRAELERLLQEKNLEMSLLARILDRADKPVQGEERDPGSDDPFSPHFNKAGSASGAKNPPREAWHA